METLVRERAERCARNAGLMGRDTIWAKADTNEGELCLVARKVDGVWRGFSACGNMAWGPMEAHEDYTYAQFEAAMVEQTSRVITEMKDRGLWANGQKIPFA